MFVGGVFIGFGTRLAGGCTSGHGIFGLANLELPKPHHHRQLHGRRASSRRRSSIASIVPSSGRYMTTLYLVLGTIFGFILSRSGAADYDFIQGMFLFTNLQLYGIIGVGGARSRRPGSG